MWGALAEYRSVTSDINISILASRLRALFAFMTTPFSPRSICRQPASLLRFELCPPYSADDQFAFQIEGLMKSAVYPSHAPPRGSVGSAPWLGVRGVQKRKGFRTITGSRRSRR